MQTVAETDGLSRPKTPSRILVVAPQPFYEDRGTPIAVRYVLEALSELGYEVDLLTYPVGETIELPGLRIFRVGTSFRIRHIPIGFSIRKLVLDMLLTFAIDKQLQREGYSCIHAVEEAAFPAAMAGRKYKVPVIYDMQSSLPEQLRKHSIFRSAIVQRGLRFFERRLISNVDFVVCSTGLGEYVRAVDPSARVAEWHFPSLAVPVSAEQTRQLRQELKIQCNSPVILYAGNFAPYQGISRLVDAALQVLSYIPNAVFVLVGANNPTDLCSSTRAKLDKRGALRVVARQPRARIPRFLAMADVLVSPRECGGNLPLKIFDYMALGKPIVATDIPVHRMLLNDDRAVLVGPTAEALTEAIVRLLRYPGEGQRLGTAAREYLKEKGGWGTFLQLMAHMYERAQGRGRGARRCQQEVMK